ncbi:MAG: 16S rRNA (uracil(1498)-N(3))-methyltransferase [Clostridia bacterium]|nr:16S rRNA (uracil(1498)-N(3))-methyltransferase [Clostridia bacterium]
MYNFFVAKESVNGNKAKITGADYNHITNVLRLKVGEEILISVLGASHLSKIEDIDDSAVTVEIIKENYQDTSLPVKIHLFQGLPKSDKLELIIQKTVELGVESITPVEMERCVVKLDGKKKDGKTARWQAIAESAAKQSKRTNIPKVESVLSYKQILEKIRDLDLFIIPYENAKGMQATKETLQSLKSGMSVGVLIGPEGGFSDNEIELAKSLNAKTVSLGKRILRTETAAITAVSMLMLYAEMNLD